jgi:protein O-mannosyl-transferase
MEKPLSGQDPSARSRGPIFLAAATIAAAAIAAYRNSFSAPFVYDDLPTIVNNPTIRHLGDLGSVLSPPPGGITVSGRPVLNFSLAVNYALGGTNVWGYHAVNLTIHILAGLALFGIMRRTLARWSGLSSTRSFGQNTALAFSVALIWTLHPLQTESVTYVIQRAESLMGLFYLLTMYCFIRYADETGGKLKAVSGKPGPQADTAGSSASGLLRLSPTAYRPPPSLWGLLSIGACLFGMATKEVMVSAPVMVFLYDRTFIAGSFGEAWRRRRRYYLGLALTWIPLICLVVGTGARGGTAGTAFDVFTASYWLTQCPAIVRYLALVVWPAPLVFDYGTPLVQSVWPVVPAIVTVGTLVAGTGWLLLRPAGRGCRAIGYAAAFFFAILAPTVVVPVLSEFMAEHRMYLALAPILAVLVCGGSGLLERFPLPPEKSGFARRAGWIFLLAVAIACGCLTARRNEDYRSHLALWSVTAEQFPANPRAQYNLGGALADEKRWGEAIAHYEEALRIAPDLIKIRYNLGAALLNAGRPAEAVATLEEVLRQEPDFPEASYNLGRALLESGKAGDAIVPFEAALRLKPRDAMTLRGMGDALAETGRNAEAASFYEESLQINPDNVKTHGSLGAVLIELGRTEQAAGQFAAASRLQPDNAEIHNILGCALAKLGRTAEAAGQFEEALRLKPDYAEARANLDQARSQR